MSERHFVTDAGAQELRDFGCLSTNEGGHLLIMTNPEDIYSDLLDTREALIEALRLLLVEYEATGDEAKVGLPNIAANDARGLLARLTARVWS